MNFSTLSSIILAIGIKITIIEKYIIEAICPIITNGYSTGWPPIHVRSNRSATNSQYIVCVIGRKIMVRSLDVCSNDRVARIRIERIRARTPPSLLGIDRRIA